MARMSTCLNCGVELDDDMEKCPLCGKPAGAFPDNAPKTSGSMQNKNLKGMESSAEDKSSLQRILWQVTSILLFSCIISTLIINLAVHKTITWSVYPVTVCMIIFSY